MSAREALAVGTNDPGGEFVDHFSDFMKQDDLMKLSEALPMSFFFVF